jgi:hypothetical protein
MTHVGVFYHYPDILKNYPYFWKNVKNLNQNEENSSCFLTNDAPLGIIGVWKEK